MFVRPSICLSVCPSVQQGKVGQGSTRRQGIGNKEYTVSREKNDTGITTLQGELGLRGRFFALGEGKEEKEENRKEEESKIDGKK